MGLTAALVLLLALILLLLARKRKNGPSEGTAPLPSAATPDSDWWDTGKTGERYTREALTPLSGYKKFLSNCYLPKADGSFTEVDLILLHESGIYVIESKNYSGWIFGSETQKQWTQTLPQGKGQAKKVRFFNPVIQNEVHLKWLRKYIDARPDLPVYSYIVFSDRCELKKITLTSGKHVVINRRNLLPAVQKNAETAEVKLTPAEIDSLYQNLFPLTQVSEEQKLLHKKTVAQKRQAVPAGNPAEKEAPVPPAPPAERKCPRCGGTLLIRTAKRGSHLGERFWGCENFPKCRYMEKLTEATAATASSSS